jgi:hypothetical protein
MVDALHRNRNLSVVVSLLLLLLFRAEHFFISAPETHSSGLLFALLLTETWSPFWQAGLNVLLSAAVILLFDQLLMHFNLGTGISGLPVFFFTVFLGLHPTFGSLSGALFGMLLMVLAFRALLANFSEQKGQINAYMFGLFIGLSVLFYAPFLAFFPFAVAALFIMKPASRKEFFALLFGLGMPVGLTFWIFFLSDYHAYVWPFPGYADLSAFFRPVRFYPVFWIFSGLVSLLFVTAFLAMLRQLASFKIITRRFYSVLMLLPFFLLLAAPLSPIASVSVFLPGAFVFSVLMSRFIPDIKNPGIVRLLMAALLLAILLGRYHHYFADTFTFKLVN